jgi:Na+-driven multidrug efflux pump
MLSLLTNDADTLKIALEYMIWVLLTQPLMALFQNYMGVFNGSGNTKYSFIIASVRLWMIRLPLIFFFKYFTDLGRSGIWYAMVISNIVILMLAQVLFRKVDFERKV